MLESPDMMSAKTRNEGSHLISPIAGESRFAGLDEIFISDLMVRGILGVHHDERAKKQDFYINLVLGADLKKAALTDDIRDTVDYEWIRSGVLKIAEESESRLVENLAERVASFCLAHPLVQTVHVRIDKPGALRFTRSVGFSLTRQK